jgi:hypothetical protein
LDLVSSTGATDFCTAGDVKEGSAEEDFEGGVLDDLDLKIDRDWSQLDGVILHES